MAFDVSVLDEPLEEVTLPRGGRTLAAREFSLGMAKLAQRMEQGDEAAALELLRRCVPGITDEEVDDLSPREAGLIIAHCAGRLKEVVEHLKKKESAAAVTGPEALPVDAKPSRRRRSSPTTRTSTP
jgi:hypothetical protein